MLLPMVFTYVALLARLQRILGVLVADARFRKIPRHHPRRDNNQYHMKDVTELGMVQMGNVLCTKTSPIYRFSV